MHEWLQHITLNSTQKSAFWKCQYCFLVTCIFHTWRSPMCPSGLSWYLLNGQFIMCNCWRTPLVRWNIHFFTCRQAGGQAGSTGANLILKLLIKHLCQVVAEILFVHSLPRSHETKASSLPESLVLAQLRKWVSWEIYALWGCMCVWVCVWMCMCMHK